jgi:hypothetical protein
MQLALIVKISIKFIGKIYEENIWGKFKDLMHVWHNLWLEPYTT